jgi:hypothetical protein
MDFVDEKNIAPFQSCEQTGEVACLFDHRPTGTLNIDAHRIGQDKSEGCLSQAGWPAQEYMFQYVFPLLGGCDHQFQAFAYAVLTLKLAEKRGAQGEIKSAFG